MEKDWAGIVVHYLGHSTIIGNFRSLLVLFKKLDKVCYNNSCNGFDCIKERYAKPIWF